MVCSRESLKTPCRSCSLLEQIETAAVYGTAYFAVDELSPQCGACRTLGDVQSFGEPDAATPRRTTALCLPGRISRWHRKLPTLISALVLSKILI